VDLLAAGSDTVASSLAWLVLCYLHYPEFKEMINDEINNTGRNNYKIS